VAEVANGRSWSPQEHQHTLEDLGTDARRAAAAAEVVQAAARERPAPADLPPFAHLSVRSSYSMRDGAIRPRELAAAAAAAGMTHVALTDRDGLYGVVRFAQAAAAEGVTPVFGTDLALSPDATRPGWELTRAGRHRLPASDRVRTGTTAGKGTHGPKRTPRRDRVQIAPVPGAGCTRSQQWRRSPRWRRWPRRVDGVIALLGPDAPVGRLLARGQHSAAEQELRHWLEVFGRERVVLGVRDHRIAPGGRRATGRSDATEPGDDARIRRTLELADHLGVRAVAVNDVRYLTPRGRPRRRAAVRPPAGPARGAPPRPDHRRGVVHHPRRAARPVRERPTCSPPRTSSRCVRGRPRHRGAAGAAADRPVADEAAGELHRRCWEGVADRYPRVTPQVRERLERELDMVDRLGLHDLFLTGRRRSWPTSARARGAGACRGSAAGSLVCFALRISDVDPVAQRPRVRAVHEPLPRRAARHRHRRGVPPARGRLRPGHGPLRRGPHRLRRDGRDLPGPHGDPRGRQGARPAPEELDVIAKSFTHARARDVRGRERLPELKGSRIDAGQLEHLFDVVERIDGLPPPPRDAPVRDPAGRRRPATARRWSAPPTGSR
jgi:error-prone DNA polymerase